MEQFLKELEAYAKLLGVQPTTVIQRAKVGNGGTWGKWSTGAGSPTLRTADRLRKYMAENPTPQSQTEDAA